MKRFVFVFTLCAVLGLFEPLLPTEPTCSLKTLPPHGVHTVLIRLPQLHNWNNSTVIPSRLLNTILHSLTPSTILIA